MIVTEIIKAKLKDVKSKQFTSSKTGEQMIIKEAVFEHKYKLKGNQYSTVVSATVGKFFEDRLPPIGADVSVSFEVNGREYNENIYNSLRIHELTSSSPTQLEIESDEIPF